MKPVYIEVRADDYDLDVVSYEKNPSRKTRLIDPSREGWNDSFHYNTKELHDDNLTFIVRLEDGTELARHTERNLKFWERERRNGK